MSLYYDPLYGNIDIDNIVFDMLGKCPELIRLRYIGLMNFKSLGMLPLTTVSRLEHTLGLAYLSQMFSGANPSLHSINDLLVASLFHDVNCGSFGHSIEWAINRYKPYDHEAKVGWVTRKEKHERFSSLDVKPIFVDQPGIHRHNFGKKYILDFDNINNIIQGKGIFVLNNKGIDLDNIDNVFRMGLYLGLLSDEQRGYPAVLANNLTIKDGLDNFLIDEKYFYLIKFWHGLRSDIYRRFIYSREYMGFENLLFRLVGEYTKQFDVDNIGNLFNFTDERLLWDFFTRSDASADLKTISKNLLLHSIPHAYSIFRTSDFVAKKSLMDPNHLDELIAELNRILINAKLYSGSSSNELYLHVTTDDRKTCRMIDIYLDRPNEQRKESVGKDERYLLIAILGKQPLSVKEIGYVNDIFMKLIGDRKLGSYENVSFSEDKHMHGSSLFKQ